MKRFSITITIASLLVLTLGASAAPSSPMTARPTISMQATAPRSPVSPRLSFEDLIAPAPPPMLPFVGAATTQQPQGPTCSGGGGTCTCAGCRASATGCTCP